MTRRFVGLPRMSGVSPRNSAPVKASGEDENANGWLKSRGSPPAGAADAHHDRGMLRALHMGRGPEYRVAILHEYTNNE